MRKFDEAYPLGGSSVTQLLNAKHARQTKSQSPTSPYMLSFLQQVLLCVGRGFQRLRRDATITITGVIVNSCLALVVGSVFYNLDETTNAFHSRGVLIFLSLLLNAFASAMEVCCLTSLHFVADIDKTLRFFSSTPRVPSLRNTSATPSTVHLLKP